jgi:hypothetical protein
MLTERRLPKLKLLNSPIENLEYEKGCKTIRDHFKNEISEEELSYYICTGEVINRGYDSAEGEIEILSENGEVNDVYKISDMLSAKAFSQITKKYFLCTSNFN